MKKCPYCGIKYPDNLELCPADQHRLQTEGATQPSQAAVTTPTPSAADEQRFWERMTMRQLALIFVRIQAIWFIFYAVRDTVYFLTYFSPTAAPGPSRIDSLMSTYTFLAIFRIMLYVAMAVFCIGTAERILGWLVKDLIPRKVSTPAPMSNFPPP